MSYYDSADYWVFHVCTQPEVSCIVTDSYNPTDFPGKPQNFPKLLKQPHQSYLYASRRCLIPFGWYANPLPSTSSTGRRLTLLQPSVKQ